VIHGRLREQGGFGLIELLIALTVMAIGIMAIVAGFSSGILAEARASHIGTAGTLADKQMEAYRALKYDQIALKSSLVLVAPAPYAVPAGDAQTGSTDLTETLVTTSGCGAASPANTCNPVRPVTGPDGRSYRVGTYIVWYCPVGALNPTDGNSATPSCGGSSSRPTKQVTVVVRDTTAPFKTWISETSVFDQAT